MTNAATTKYNVIARPSAIGAENALKALEDLMVAAPDVEWELAAQAAAFAAGAWFTLDTKMAMLWAQRATWASEQAEEIRLRGGLAQTDDPDGAKKFAATAARAARAACFA